MYVLDVMIQNTFVQESFELFVDRQRQAAVVLGERDIAGDVKAKRKRDRQAISKTLLSTESFFEYCLECMWRMQQSM